jgi:predicted branched-subunit amino acid permease
MYITPATPASPAIAALFLALLASVWLDKRDLNCFVTKIGQLLVGLLIVWLSLLHLSVLLNSSNNE